MKTLLSIFILIAYSFVYSQENSEILITLKKKDSVFHKENRLKMDWEIRSRSFFMSTQYSNPSLKNDYASLSGVGIGILTRPVYGFQIGISSFVYYNLFSSQVQQPDPLTLAQNRYEIGLFDITQPNKKNNLARLEELFLKYTLSKSSITVGKILLNTPFFNPEDGRMRPSFEEGVWLTIAENKKFGFNGGWIWSVSPRSTLKWYRLQESVGIYPVGVNDKGVKFDYFGNITTQGIAIANVYFKPSTKIKINLWDGYLDNIMNTGIIEINTKQNLSEKTNVYQGLMYVHQDALNNGGNADQSKTYIKKGSTSNIISAQFVIKHKKNNTSINYTHITGDGQYLMPREWGRDMFYTFLPRERNEGLGNVHAFVLKSGLSFNHFKTSLAYGYYQLPDVKNYRLNKYGMPSYEQINYDATYKFEKSLRGLEIKTVIACKILKGNIYNNLKYEYNKVNLINFNLIIDYKI